CITHSLAVSLLFPLHPVSLFFFFYVSGAHLVLPSFPTRRSSDLVVHGREGGVLVVEQGGEVAGAEVGEGAADLGVGGERLRHRRSEEHTSELQSRRDLVCRLLLEKKKKKLYNKERNEHSRQYIEY